jgi:hypothetical protein
VSLICLHAFCKCVYVASFKIYFSSLGIVACASAKFNLLSL